MFSVVRICISMPVGCISSKPSSRDWMVQVHKAARRAVDMNATFSLRDDAVAKEWQCS